MRVQLLGGFLGAGKTTLARALAGRLSAKGERVAIITNDQGRALVDTALCQRDGGEVREIAGGCFCCRYDELEAALLGAAAAGATIAIAEAVGSCTDLIATVLSPLADRHPGTFQLAPLAVVVDPWRLVDVGAGRAHPDVAYLIRKQIEEADVVLLGRADLQPPDVTDLVLAIRPEAAVVAVSGAAAFGLDDWMAARPACPANPLLIDYDRYAAAEALLGWCNARVRVIGNEPFSAGDLARSFLELLLDAPIAHVKLADQSAAGGRAAVVRAGDAPRVDFPEGACRVLEAVWLLNARIAMPPAVLVERLKAALAAAAAPHIVVWEELEAFEPARPVPRHRYTFRCGSGDDAACCAAFYDRADVRALLGDSWHPGGIELTLAMAEQLGLGDGKRVLDVACGRGTSLRALLARWPITAVGLDAQSSSEGEASLSFVRGDAHRIPFPDASFDALMCECAVSTFSDQKAALQEMYRVLRPGARVAISDMAVEGEIPEGLREWVNTGTCLAGALTGDAYVRVLRAAGFRVVAQWDASDGLRELLRRIKRNLVGAALAAASGQLGVGLTIDAKRARQTLREAERAIASGSVRYLALVAERAA